MADRPPLQPASPWWTPQVHADRRPILMARNRIEAAIRGYLAGEDFVMVDPPGLQVVRARGIGNPDWAQQCQPIDTDHVPIEAR